MLGGDLNALGDFKDKLFEYGAVFTEANNKEAIKFCFVLFRLAEHQVASAAHELTGMSTPCYITIRSGRSCWNLQAASSCQRQAFWGCVIASLFEMSLALT